MRSKKDIQKAIEKAKDEPTYDRFNAMNNSISTELLLDIRELLKKERTK